MWNLVWASGLLSAYSLSGKRVFLDTAPDSAVKAGLRHSVIDSIPQPMGFHMFWLDFGRFPL